MHRCDREPCIITSLQCTHIHILCVSHTHTHSQRQTDTHTHTHTSTHTYTPYTNIKHLFQLSRDKYTQTNSKVNISSLSLSLTHTHLGAHFWHILLSKQLLNINTHTHTHTWEHTCDISFFLNSSWISTHTHTHTFTHVWKHPFWHTLLSKQLLNIKTHNYVDRQWVTALLTLAPPHIANSIPRAWIMFVRQQRKTHMFQAFKPPLCIQTRMSSTYTEVSNMLTL